MSVLLVNMSIDPVKGGGTANRTLRLAKAINKAGVECFILSTNHGYSKGCRYQNDPLIVLLSCLNDRFYIPYIQITKISALIKKVDIIHLMSHWTIINAIVFLFAKYYRKPYTFCPAGTLYIYGRSRFLKNAYNYLVGNRIISGAKKCITITELEKNDLFRHGVSDSRIITIPNGIDSGEFYPNEAAGRIFREKYKLIGVRFILFMGRLNLIKGPDLLLGAYLRMVNDVPDVHLVMAGLDEGLYRSLMRYVTDNGLMDKVHFIGHIDGICKSGAYSSAEVLVIPSRREAMSIVALEAGACGTPVILTTECGFNEVKNVGCEVVKPNMIDLHKALAKCMMDPAGLLVQGRNLKEMVLKNYTWAQMAARYLKL